MLLVILAIPVYTKEVAGSAPPATSVPSQATSGIILNGINVSSDYGYDPADMQGYLHLVLSGSTLANAQCLVPDLIRSYGEQITNGAMITFTWNGIGAPGLMYTTQASATVAP